MELKQCILTKNDCYKKGRKATPKGIVVHSTGANNPNLKRYVQPDDGILGKNTNNNDWNRSGISKCVHAFIGKDKNGVVRCYQTLPFNYACWGVGKGKKGSYNSSPAYIQFEICEDNLKNEEYFNQVFGLAIEFCVYLCEKYNLSINNIVSHQEAYKKGYGSNHGDCDHWLKKFGKDMDWFRSEVEARLNSGSQAEKENQIEVDGIWGKATTRKAQEVFKTTIDGVISNQYKIYQDENPGLSSSTFEWESKPGSSGSKLIKAIQKKVGVKEDGFIGTNTIKAMQKWLGTTQDGHVSRPSQMVKAFQKWLNEQ